MSEFEEILFTEICINGQRVASVQNSCKIFQREDELVEKAFGNAQ